MTDPELMVTIRCITYNQENFISQCLDGFVKQKTNFRFEAIVHDDASTDGTVQIIKKYAKKYPDIIKPILETENQYCKHDGSLGRIMLEHTHGKYVALCEGDDYWTDPYKLQKQVDFMEANPNYSLCFHNSVQHWENDEHEDSLFVRNNIERDYSGVEIFEKWTIPTASTLIKSEIFRSSLYESVSKDNRFVYGDIVLFLTASNYGKLHFLKDVMSVYRRHENGATNWNDFNKRVKLTGHFKAIKQYFGKDYFKSCNCFLSTIYYDLFSESRHNGKYLFALKSLFSSFFYSPKIFYYITAHLVRKKILHIESENKHAVIY